MKNKRGITLIALVITIIILLILAGITIIQLTESGLFKKSTLASQKYKNSQDLENSILEEYEKSISTSRDSYIEDLNIVIEDVISENISFKISTKEVYDNAIYVFIVNNKIVDHGEINSTITKDLTPETDYDVIVVIVESNGKIHKGTKKYKTRKENVDVYKKVEEAGGKEKLSEYGITYTREGKSQTIYDKLYELGMGSGTGINSNTFTLTINYDVLKSKLGNENFRGIYGQFWHKAYTYNGYTSWIVSKIIVTYEDGSTSENSTEKTSVKNSEKNEELYTSVAFENNKKISQIQMIISEYDSDCGEAYGYIKNIGLIP